MAARFRVKNTFPAFSGNALSVTRVTVKPYLANGQLIAAPAGDATYVPDTATGTVAGGILKGADGLDGIELQSDTDDLNLAAPLMYQMAFTGAKAGTKNVKLPVITFPASTDTSERQLSDYIPSPPTPESTEVAVTLPGDGDGTTYLNDQGQFTEPAGGAGGLPPQTGQTGKFLTTNGATPSWGTPLADVAAAIHAAATKTTPASSDELALADSAAAWALKRITYGQLAAAIMAAIVDSAPGTLDTLNELAAALGDDPNFAATMATALSDKQPIDADLTAIAALTSAANKLAYATGAGTWALTDFPPFGRSLAAGADAAAVRTLLGLIALPAQSGQGGKYLTTDGSALSWGTVAGGSSLVTVNPQTTDYTLAASDDGKAVEMTSSSDRTITVPTNASVPIPVGVVIEVARMGTGGLQIIEGGGGAARVDTSTSRVLRAQYANAVLRKRGTDLWLLSGDLQ